MTSLSDQQITKAVDDGRKLINLYKLYGDEPMEDEEHTDIVISLDPRARHVLEDTIHAMRRKEGKISEDVITLDVTQLCNDIISAYATAALREGGMMNDTRQLRDLTVTLPDESRGSYEDTRYEHTDHKGRSLSKRRAAVEPRPATHQSEGHPLKLERHPQLGAAPQAGARRGHERVGEPDLDQRASQREQWKARLSEGGRSAPTPTQSETADNGHRPDRAANPQRVERRAANQPVRDQPDHVGAGDVVPRGEHLSTGRGPVADYEHGEWVFDDGTSEPMSDTMQRAKKWEDDLDLSIFDQTPPWEE